MYFKFSKWAIKNGLVYDQIESLLSVSTVYSDCLRVYIFCYFKQEIDLIFLYIINEKSFFFSFNISIKINPMIIF